MTRRLPSLQPPAAPPWLDWPDFRRRFAALYKPGDHVSIIGPTGTGKTVLAMEILSMRSYAIYLASKPPADKELRRLKRSKQWHLSPDGDIPSARIAPKVLVWPPYKSEASLPVQRAAFTRAADTAFAEGWTLCYDELAWACERLAMGGIVKSGFQQGRSQRNGLVVCTQRPAWVPRDIYSGATHLFLFGTNDSEDLKRIGGLNGSDPAIVRRMVASMPRDHRFLYLHTPTGKIASSRLTKG